MGMYKRGEFSKLRDRFGQKPEIPAIFLKSPSALFLDLFCFISNSYCLFLYPISFSNYLKGDKHGTSAIPA